MQIVIDIPEKVYERFGYEYSEENCISKYTNDIILDAFCTGIPLPKGHGDLIDRSMLPTDYITEDDITDASAIIKADTEGDS